MQATKAGGGGDMGGDGKRRRGARYTVLALGAAMVSAGCWTRAPVGLGELAKLHGYHDASAGARGEAGATAGAGPRAGARAAAEEAASAQRAARPPATPLVSVEGDAILFSSETELTLHLRDGRAVTEKYRRISVEGGRFSGVAVDEHRVRLPLSAVAAATVEHPDGLMTLLVSLAVAGGLMALLLVGPGTLWGR